MSEPKDGGMLMAAWRVVLWHRRVAHGLGPLEPGLTTLLSELEACLGECPADVSRRHVTKEGGIYVDVNEPTPPTDEGWRFCCDHGPYPIDKGCSGCKPAPPRPPGHGGTDDRIATRLDRVGDIAAAILEGLSPEDQEREVHKLEAAASRYRAASPPPDDAEEAAVKIHDLYHHDEGDRHCTSNLAKSSSIIRAYADKRVEKLEKRLRYVLWAGHGHLGIYGDDGEMQCGECRLDYKRDPLDAIEKRLEENAVERLADSQKHRADVEHAARLAALREAARRIEAWEAPIPGRNRALGTIRDLIAEEEKQCRG